ncbi:MAG: hypothetical protein J6B23_10145, partial [Clostridia bacterium]|nr:hypothetical protein [Clostridia bacterium]
MVIKTEQNEKKITTIGILFALYISLITTINNNVVLYTGYVCLLGVLVIKLIFHNDYNMTISSYTKNYIWFALYCITSFFWAYDPSMTINHIPHMVACTILMVFMIDYFVKKKSVAPIYWTIAFVGVFMAVYVVVSYGGFKEFYNIATTEQHNFEAQRVGSAVTNVNIIGMQCGFAGIVL